MANYVYVNYVIEGPEKDLNKIYNTIKEYGLTSDSDFWEVGLLDSLNIEWEKEKYYIRGFILKNTAELNNGVLSFDAEEEWGLSEFNIILKRRFPDLTVYYCLEGEQEAIFATNDKEGKYFPERFRVDCCVNGNTEGDYFDSEKIMYHWLANRTQGRVRTHDDVERFNKQAAEDSLEDYISIRECSVE